MQKEYMLSTFDNPYNPFHHFTLWDLFDREHGHNSCALIARVLEKNGISAFDGLSQVELDAAADDAIDEIIMNDDANVYIRVTPDTKPKSYQPEL